MILIIVLIAFAGIFVWPKISDRNGDTGWQTFTDNETGIFFKYPEKFSTTYIEAYDWPPRVEVLDEPFSCTETGEETARAGETRKVTVGNRGYCVTSVVGAAAGSIYTQYAFAFPKNDKTVILTFTVRSVQCGNYDEPQKILCEAERETFDVNIVIDYIAQSVSLNREGK